MRATKRATRGAHPVGKSTPDICHFLKSIHYGLCLPVTDTCIVFKAFLLYCCSKEET